jgi:hypothetical protein
MNGNVNKYYALDTYHLKFNLIENYL